MIWLKRGRLEKMKRAPRVGLAKPGELKAKWAKMQHSKPDICYVWGEGVPSADARLLDAMLTREHYRVGQDWEEKPEPSFIQELEMRGYDITTLKFSIQKKVN